MRKYQAIWEKIKTEGFAVVTAETNLHTRIVLCVRKEKNLDLAFKLESAELGKKYRLEDSHAGKVITFRLEEAGLIGTLR